MDDSFWDDRCSSRYPVSFNIVKFFHGDVDQIFCEIYQAIMGPGDYKRLCFLGKIVRHYPISLIKSQTFHILSLINKCK